MGQPHLGHPCQHSRACSSPSSTTSTRRSSGTRGRLATPAWSSPSAFAIGEPLPDVGALDAVVSLGGDQSAASPNDDPLLAPEVEFLRAAAGAGLPVLGICLGGSCWRGRSAAVCATPGARSSGAPCA